MEDYRDMDLTVKCDSLQPQATGKYLQRIPLDWSGPPTEMRAAEPIPQPCNDKEFPVQTPHRDLPLGPYQPTVCLRVPTTPPPQEESPLQKWCQNPGQKPGKYATVISGEPCHDIEPHRPEPTTRRPVETPQGSPQSYPLASERRCLCLPPGPCKCGFGRPTPEEEKIPEDPVPQILDPNEPFEFYPGLMESDRLGKLRPDVFRSSDQRYSPAEWQRYHDTRLSQSDQDQNMAWRASYQAKCSMATHSARAESTQKEATKQLHLRLETVLMSKWDFHEQIRRMRDETGRMADRAHRVMNAINVINRKVVGINGERLRMMTERRDIELVKDVAEVDLQDERVLIKNVLDLLNRLQAQATDMVGSNRAINDRMMKVWSDKVEALDMEVQAKNLADCTPTNVNHHGVARFQEWESTPATLEEFNQMNMCEMTAQYNASVRLRSTVDRTLQDCADQLLSKMAQVNTSISQRMYEVGVALKELEVKLRTHLQFMADTEKMIGKVKQAILNLNGPMKKTQTRLFLRAVRPGMELCRDQAQYKLIEQVGEINQSVTELEDMLRAIQESLDRLHETRLDLDDDISKKRSTLELLQRCSKAMSPYPAMEKLLGY